MSVKATISKPQSRKGAPPDAEDTRPRTTVAIVGAGISGLALGFELKRAGVSCVILEKSNRVGGVIGSLEANGFGFERGPNTLLDKSPAVDRLVEAAGLRQAAQRSPVRNQSRYIWHGAKLHKVPTGPGEILATGLLSVPSKLGLVREFLVPAVQADESLESMIRRRFGNEIYTRVFVPMVQGIWAGDPAGMSAEASFPMLKQWERAHGSVIRGFMASMKTNARTRHAAGRGGGPCLLSFEGGLERLPLALANAVLTCLRLETTVESVRRDDPGYVLNLATATGTESLVAESVVLCGEAFSMADLLLPLAEEAAVALHEIHYAPIVSVGLGVEANSLRLPPGFGFLAARDQGVRVLGCIFNSNFLPGRAPQGCATLTVMLGGDLDPDAVNLDDAELLNTVKHDLATVLGWNGEYREARISRWSRAIPRYGMDHARLCSLLQRAESAHPGLHFFGNFQGGVSLGDRIERAATLAAEITATSSPQSQSAP